MESLVPFYSSLASTDWEALGYPSQEVALFWDTRSCGVACLRMAYGYLAPTDKLLPAALTEELLRIGAYSEAGGWSHLGLARHARARGFTAQLLRLPRPDDLWAAVTTPGILIVSIGASSETESSRSPRRGCRLLRLGCHHCSLAVQPGSERRPEFADGSRHFFGRTFRAGASTSATSIPRSSGRWKIGRPTRRPSSSRRPGAARESPKQPSL